MCGSNVSGQNLSVPGECARKAGGLVLPPFFVSADYAEPVRQRADLLDARVAEWLAVFGLTLDQVREKMNEQRGETDVQSA